MCENKRINYLKQFKWNELSDAEQMELIELELIQKQILESGDDYANETDCPL